MRETHISWVFLVDDRAYKLKKPLVLSFLNYATAARRRQMCLDEVRLNRRLAPSIYLGVRAIMRTPSGIELSAQDDPRAVDYVVEMRRYDEDRTLAATLQRRELTGSDVDQVARTLADFHGRCDRVSGPEYGAHNVEREVDRNVKELLAVTEQRDERGKIHVLARFMAAFVESRRRELDARATEGRIRECHGDLRAEHVVLGTTISVVDCVEFDASLRTLDVADDLAFLIMDLAALGGHGFGAALVDAYRTAGGEPGDDPLLAFFAVHRALVRAKVLFVRAGQEPPGRTVRGRASAGARDLLDHAERFSWRARLPVTIAFCGVPASGKSHLATEIAHRSRLAHLSSDVTRKQLAGRRPTQAAGPEHYHDEFSEATYAQLGRLAASEVETGGGVLVDATFRRRRDREAFARSFAHASPLLFVECLAPADVLARRARAREHDPDRVSDATLEIVMRERETWEPLDELAPTERVTLRTDRPLARITADLLALLDHRLGVSEDRQPSPG